MGGRKNRKRGGRSSCCGTTEPLTNNSSCSLNLNRYLQIKHSEDIGRYLVASEDVLPGTILLQEDPIVIGPNFGTGPTCLRCGDTIQLLRNSTSRCENCEWPLCADHCPEVSRKNLHTSTECEMLSRAAKKPREPGENKLFNIITPLRVLLTRKHNPEKWREVQELESHDDIRKTNKDQWKFYQQEIVDVIREMCGFLEFTEDEVHTICGYLQVNSFSVERSNMKGLYPRVYLLAHSCVPNTSHIIASDYKITLRATTPIKKGEIITLSYTDTFQGTIQRRTHLKESKYFECKCERCRDPTELGTNFSTLKCQKCDKGFWLPENPLNPESPWICRNSRCGFIETSTNVLSITRKAREEIDKAKNTDIVFWEKFLNKYEDVLHHNHHIMTTARCSLSQQYGKVPNYMIDEMSLEQLQRKIRLCQDVLKVTDVIEPGLSRLRGITMYELHAPLLLYAIKTFQRGTSNKELLKRRLREVVKYLEEAARILAFEDPLSAEGKILKAIESALKETKTWETQLKNV